MEELADANEEISLEMSSVRHFFCGEVSYASLVAINCSDREHAAVFYDFFKCEILRCFLRLKFEVFFSSFDTSKVDF